MRKKSNFKNPFSSFETLNESYRVCEKEGCSERGEYKAPYDRYHLNRFRWFCLDHVREYNQTWDYFQGLSEEKINAVRTNDLSWQRPTWPMGDSKSATRFFILNAEDELLSDLQAFEKNKQKFREPDPQKNIRWFARNSEESRALDNLGLKQPTNYEDVKKQYKRLVKKYHPDVNGGCPKNQEKIKVINVAFRILKIAFEN